MPVKTQRRAWQGVQDTQVFCSFMILLATVGGRAATIEGGCSLPIEVRLGPVKYFQFVHAACPWRSLAGSVGTKWHPWRLSECAKMLLQLGGAIAHIAPLRYGSMALVGGPWKCFDKNFFINRIKDILKKGQTVPSKDNIWDVLIAWVSSNLMSW